MPKPPHPRWKEPRATIACKFKDNEFGYAMHGTLAALVVLKTFDLKPSECANLTVLDYGCGTGREARTLSVLFKEVIAFDPTPECLQEFEKEIKSCDRDFPNIKIVGRADEIPTGIDLAYSMHVIEHLNTEESEYMLNQLKTKVTGKTVLAYDAERNRPLLEKYMSAQDLENDAKRFREENRRIRIRLFDFNKA